MSGVNSPTHFHEEPIFIALFIAAGSAGAEEKGAILEESGIRYPYGFDPNTVGEIRGKVFKFSRPDRGPVRFRLESKQDTYTVLASPAWFWKDIKADITEGAEARVRGSKSLGKDGNLYIVAQKVHLIASGRSLVFRSDNGFPSGWSRNRDQQDQDRLDKAPQE
ncbi:MAG: hypothetical protein ACYC37_05285 [Desulfobacteria bacterium]